MSAEYDYLIVGAGLYGAVFAHELTTRGYRCLVIDRRSHIGGNVYTEMVADVCVHRYGAHIFHTSDETVWEYVSRFARFNNFINSPLAVYGDEIYNLPFNMNTFVRLWPEVRTPEEAHARIAAETAPYQAGRPQNLEEQALRLVGPTVYEKLVKGYTEKQWGRDCRELPAFIIRRLPLRFTFDNNYFNDRYQGIPEGGYTPLVEKLLVGSEVRTNTPYSDALPKPRCKTIYTGAIDEFFDFSLGHLEYRSLRFETELLDTPDYQGNAVVNYTARDVPYTRIIEHKHFAHGTQAKTVISREYPLTWQPGLEPYYAVNDERNDALYQKYRALADARPDVLFGGRLGSYRYYDMDRVVAQALSDSARELESRGKGG